MLGRLRVTTRKKKKPARRTDRKRMSKQDILAAMRQKREK